MGLPIDIASTLDKPDAFATTIQTEDLGSCRISDSLAQTKGGVVYRHVMPHPPDSRYATPTNSSYNMYVCVYARRFDY